MLVDRIEPDALGGGLLGRPFDLDGVPETRRAAKPGGWSVRGTLDAFELADWDSWDIEMLSQSAARRPHFEGRERIKLREC
jgi:hypothetical protein